MSADPGRKPTSFDVARLAGVSRSAVSRAFTPGGAVAEKTRQKVFAAASELGYRVNSLARALQGEHSGIMGVLASRLDTPVRSRQVKLLAQAMLSDGYRPMLVTAEHPEDVAGLFDMLLGYNVAGVVVTSDTPPQSAIEACRHARVPVVLINRAEPAAGWGDRVVADPGESGALAHRILVQAGVTRPAVLTPAAPSYSVTGRTEAFARAAPGTLRLAARDQSYAAARAALCQAGADGFDGLFCATDLMALGALDALRLDLGVAVPEQVQVLGFDDIEQASWGAYQLSTIRQDFETQTALAIRLLQARIADRDLPTRTEAVPIAPVIRATTRPPGR